jgi:putative phage-type endonuclease
MAITPEQAKARVGRIGSSNVAEVLGISPYGNRSPQQQKRDAYFKILGLHPKKDSESMRDGVFLEPAILNWAEYKIGKPFMRDQQDERHTRIPMIASYDGLSSPEDGFIVEVKWVENPIFQDHWGRAGSDQVPGYVLCQVLHQLYIAGPDYQTAYVAVLRCKNGFGLYKVKRDDEQIAELVEAERRFYVDHILPKRPPQVVEAEDVELMPV